jgi:predicted DNA-binding transcriptional regulator AlpA
VSKYQRKQSQAALARKAAAFKAAKKAPAAARATSSEITEGIAAFLQQQGEGPRVLLKSQVLERINVSFPTLWAWMRDGKFPRARQMGKHTVWLESDVNDWITALPIKEYLGDTEEVA